MNRTNNNIRKFAYVIGILIVIIVVIRFQQRISEMNHLEGQLKLIQTQGTSVMRTQERLLTQVAFVTSDEAVKEWAYSKGRWYLPNETPIIILPVGNATPIPDGSGIMPTDTVENWQVWWELFFGEKN
ncbi:MAG: hypothetical protein A2X25_02255 [Chloroflexi bacterium GWB2_49_20]|nr:MAG: hypothetical protein A2X25_02255 [Chloroflexi bacterium GWB2_49_20]OGN78267.1 MAG: hypothetical protein A2X26_14860 [Chloroflexi bacterium GWC2_49_37]OGN85303.1 MAG: hypothetical protein A2X27_07515 [Chloroflexi bacterium GWD2_49_16]